MDFKSQVCTTKEQSKRLLSLGLKKETADMAHLVFDEYSGLTIRPYVWQPTTEVDMENFIPAWSLDRLIELANTYIEYSPFTGVCFRDGAFRTDRVNDYDAIVDIIEWLIKEEDFNKEYLEE